MNNRTWLAFAKREICKHDEAIDKLGFINWKMPKRKLFSIGDIVYLFVSNKRKVRFKMVVTDENCERQDKKYWVVPAPNDRTYKLELLEEYKGELLDEKELRRYGFSGGGCIQNPSCNNTALMTYIGSIFSDYSTPALISNIKELIRNLETVESYINEDATEEHFSEMSDYIKRGRNFVAYSVGNNWHFAPSRFIGYKDNSIERHRLFRESHVITGTETDARLSSSLLFGVEKDENQELENHYREYCKWLGVEPENRIHKFWILDEDVESKFIGTTPFYEGTLKLKLHKQRERNPKVVKEAKRLFKQKNGQLYCEICSFIFEEIYGHRGVDFIEAHHDVPISEQKELYEIKPQDFTMVCSNCHSMLHRSVEQKTPTIKELKQLFKK